MAPWGGFLLNAVIVIIIAPLKIVGLLIQWNFKRIVRNCAAAEQKERIDEARADRLKKREELLKSENSGSVRPKRE